LCQQGEISPLTSLREAIKNLYLVINFNGGVAIFLSLPGSKQTNKKDFYFGLVPGSRHHETELLK